MTRPPTLMEKRLLRVLTGHPRCPADLIREYPLTFGDRTVQGVHQTAASLVRKGLASRWPGTPVAYTITPEGRNVIS